MQTSQGTLQFPARINFSSSPEPIELELSEAKTYPCGGNKINIDAAMMNSIGLWHMVIVHHEGKVSRKEILHGFFKLLQNEFFAPAAYCSGDQFDYFFLNSQPEALAKLFENNLMLKIADIDISLSIKLGAAKWNKRQPRVFGKINCAIQSRIKEMRQTSTLDFNNFANSLELADFVISLRNKKTLNVICDQLNKQERFKRIELRLIFAGNDLSTLEPFTKMFNFQIAFLDLKNNDIEIDQFHYLKHLNIDMIECDGNDAILRTPNYSEKILKIIPSLKRLDSQTRPSEISKQIAPQKMPNISIPTTSVQQPKVELGLGNNLITHLQTGIPITYDPRRRVQFAQLKDTFTSYRDEKSWTQVIVQCSGITKEEVLECLVREVFENCLFFPCYYQVFASHHEFFVYKNFEALRCLMNKDLELTNKLAGGNKKFRITLKMNVAIFEEGQVDWMSKIRRVLTNRIDGDCLNLDNFAKDAFFSRLTIVMNSKSNLSYILDSAKKLSPRIKSISLKQNNLKTIKALHTINFQMPSVVKIDLRDNGITIFGASETISRIKEIQIDKNPICNIYQNPKDLVNSVLKQFPDLQILDGVDIDPSTKVPILQNFLITNHCYNFVDELIKTFYGIYDSDRHRLKEFYSATSVFTMSSLYDAGRSTFNMSALYARMQPYMISARFLQKIANMTQVYQNFFVGPESIVEVLNKLPRSKHDLSTFCVDVPFYNSKSFAVIKVSGTFQDYGNSLNDKNELLLGFSRTFIVKFEENDQISILNDQLFIYNTIGPLISIDNAISKNECEEQIDEDEENQVKLILFRELTNLKQHEALKLLTEYFFDFKVTLGIFKTLMDNGKIPETSFEFET